ncbi:MAG: 4-alpha-glucanotransferase [Herpetosiphon sp.]
MALSRASGILLHPTSFPGRGGIGELGSAAYRFIDWLVQGGQRLWQILPLGPTGYGDSPYACFSASAGNPMLISLEMLQRQGLLTEDEVGAGADFSADTVDFGQVIGWKMTLLQQAFHRAMEYADSPLTGAFAAFCRDEAGWLEDFALFMALKDRYAGAPWNQWDAPVRRRETGALEAVRNELRDTVQLHRFLQFLFFAQWRDVKHYANERGVQIMGDIPIFVAYDSADVWSNPETFFLDEAGNPTVVSGVPPDYFSETGQRWGNPLYRWDVLAARGYDWWIERLRATLKTVDFVRIDHFRGFEGYWEIPAADATAVNGRWVKGPGTAVFVAIKEALGEVPIVAEDLGLITPEVEAIRDAMHIPGMKVLQFAWADDANNPYLPHSHVQNCVVYTATHDNDTTMGWYATSSERERAYFHAYVDVDHEHVARAMHRLALQSVAALAIAPLQDVLELPSEARMNLPGRASGNWGWRYQEGVLTDELAGYLLHVTTLYGRAAP